LVKHVVIVRKSRVKRYGHGKKGLSSDFETFTVALVCYLPLKMVRAKRVKLENITEDDRIIAYVF
jgi:hypothetical protein